MKVILEKPSPKWLDQYDIDGKKIGRKRVMKLEMVADKEEFPDAMSFDGAEMILLRPFEYEQLQMATEGNTGKLDKIQVYEAMISLIETWHDELKEKIREEHGKGLDTGTSDVGNPSEGENEAAPSLLNEEEK